MTNEEKLRALADEMIRCFSGDPKRIQHFVKVHAFAKQIAEEEALGERERFRIEAAALTHDIGIRKGEALYGRCDGEIQQELGPGEARSLLEKLDFDAETTARVCWMIGRHHTYTNVDGADLQVLIEADFLVNLYEESASEQSVRAAYRKIFRTENGKRLCREMFGVEGAESEDEKK